MSDPHRPKGNAPASAFERKSLESHFRPVGEPSKASVSSALPVNTVSPPLPAVPSGSVPAAASASANEEHHDADFDTVSSITNLYLQSLENIKKGDKNSVEYLNRIEANREFFVKALYVANKAESQTKYDTMEELNADMPKLYLAAIGKTYTNSDPDNTIKFDYMLARDIIPLLVEKARSEIAKYNIFDGLTAVYDNVPSHIEVLKSLNNGLSVDTFKELYPSSLFMNYSFFYPGVPNALGVPNAVAVPNAATESAAPTPSPSPAPAPSPTPETTTTPAPETTTTPAPETTTTTAPAPETTTTTAPVSEYLDTAAFRAKQHPYYSDGPDIVAVYDAAIAKGEDGDAAALQARRMRKEAEAASGATSMAPVTATAAPETSASLSINIPKSKRPEEVQGWQIKESRSQPGLFYYYNPVTKVSTRTRPEPTGSNVGVSSSTTSTPAGSPASTPPGSPKLGSQPVPSDGDVWEEQISKSTGKTYYYNPKTKVSQWVKPEVKSNEVASTPKAGSESVAHANGDVWEEKVSKSTGKTYYYNPKTKVSQWVKPVTSSLPSGWEEIMNAEGKPYYARKKENGSWNANSTTYEKPVVLSLPAGWEEIMNSEGKPYYVQRNNKGEYIANSSTRERPVTGAAAATAATAAAVQPEALAGSAPKQNMHWNAVSGKWVDDVPTEAKISAINKARQEAQKGGSRKKRRLTPRRRTIKK
jgi:hypothetical protein